MRGLATLILLGTLMLLSRPAPLAAQVGKRSTLWKWTTGAIHHDSVVQVSLKGSIGTGIIVDVAKHKPVGKGFEGLCMTAYHVVEPDAGKREVEVLYRNGRVSEKALVVQFDRERDIALLWVWVPDDIHPAKFAPHAARPGDSLEIAGLGGGSKLDCCMRHFSSAASSPTNQEVILCDVALLPGDSGGPVFNADHEVVGVISGGWFWWDGGIQTEHGYPISVTWPAKACNVAALKQLQRRVPAWYAGNQPTAALGSTGPR